MRWLQKVCSHTTVLKRARDMVWDSLNDPITGLINHYTWQETLASKLTNSIRLTVLLVDVNHFHIYNRQIGYRAGNQLLRSLANLLMQVVPPDSLIGRYGGDEFAVALPGWRGREALSLVTELKARVENHSFPGQEDLPGGRVTVSVGMANYPRDAATQEDLLRAVVQALYQDKQGGQAHRLGLYHEALGGMKSLWEASENDLLVSIQTLVCIVNAKDAYTFGHTSRVVDYALLLGKVLQLNREELSLLRYGAFLHDIGKIEIDRRILNKPEALTKEEWLLVQEHPVIGADILRPVAVLTPVIPLVRHHHERFDGQGYPYGLAGKEIPLLARVITVADSFDAMTTRRPYRQALSWQAALGELNTEAGVHFDGDLVAGFTEALSRLKQQEATM